MAKCEDVKERILGMLQNGYKPREIIAELGIPRSTYYYHLSKLDTVVVRVKDVKNALEFFLENAENLPELSWELEKAFDRLAEAIGGMEQ